MSAGFAITVGVALTVSTTSLAIAAPTINSDYPSWADVQAAKASQAATQVEITKLAGLLTTLSDQVDVAGKDAAVKAELYNQARDALSAATAKTAKLKAQADAAKSTAAKSAKRAAALISQLARTGGGDISLGVLLGSKENTDQLLASLGTASRLSQSTEGILQQAQFDKNSATSLAASAAVAQKKRVALAADAKTANDSAQQAAATANATLARTQATSSTMYAQLASLKGTTAAVEAQFQAGVEASKAVVTPPRPAGGSNAPGGSSSSSGSGGSSSSSGSSGSGSPSGTGSSSGGSGSSGGSSTPVVDPSPPAPVAGAVTGAITYAKAQLGKPYQLGGAGPDVWDCSGLTLRSYQSVGVYIGSHSSTNQYTTMRAAGKLVALSQVQAGDLLFYTGDGGAVMYHVAMAIGGGQMIEAPELGSPVRIVTIRYGDLWPYAGRPTA